MRKQIDSYRGEMDSYRGEKKAKEKEKRKKKKRDCSSMVEQENFNLLVVGSSPISPRAGVHKESVVPGRKGGACIEG